jgi:methylaspartate mutase sigma subunit
MEEALTDHASTPLTLPTEPGGERPVLLAVPESDCHVVACKLLELYLRNHGYPVINLGVATPNAEIAESVARFSPVAVFICAQNGHALRDLSGLQDELRKRLCTVPLFIGGKLTIGPEIEQEDVRASFSEIGFEVLRDFDEADKVLRRLVQQMPIAQLPEETSS